MIISFHGVISFTTKRYNEDESREMVQEVLRHEGGDSENMEEADLVYLNKSIARSEKELVLP